jgi:amino-acid N-acetyltransferase
MSEIKYSFAEPSDISAIAALLGQSHLPADNIEPRLPNTLVARADGRLVGTISLELCGPFGFLRSLAVDPDFRGRSIGKHLCERLLNLARLLKIEHVYLLTLDAEQYFAKQGFTRIERTAAPAEIAATSQFRGLCPKTAVCMTRAIGHDAIHASTDLLRLKPDVPGAKMWAVSLQNTMLTYFEVQPHSRFESHSHESEQITMVLTGELFFELNGKVHCINAKTVLCKKY